MNLDVDAQITCGLFWNTRKTKKQKKKKTLGIIHREKRANIWYTLYEEGAWKHSSGVTILTLNTKQTGMKFKMIHRSPVNQ